MATNMASAAAASWGWGSTAETAPTISVLQPSPHRAHLGRHSSLSWGREGVDADMNREEKRRMRICRSSERGREGGGCRYDRGRGGDFIRWLRIRFVIKEYLIDSDWTSLHSQWYSWFVWDTMVTVRSLIGSLFFYIIYILLAKKKDAVRGSRTQDVVHSELTFYQDNTYPFVLRCCNVI